MDSDTPNPANEAGAPAAEESADAPQYAPDEIIGASSAPEPAAGARADVNLDLVLDIPVDVSLRVGPTDISIRDLVSLVDPGISCRCRLPPLGLSNHRLDSAPGVFPAPATRLENSRVGQKHPVAGMRPEVFGRHRDLLHRLRRRRGPQFRARPGGRRLLRRVQGLGSGGAPRQASTGTVR